MHQYAAMGPLIFITLLIIVAAVRYRFYTAHGGESMEGAITLNADIRDLTPTSIKSYLKSRLNEVRKEIEIQDKFIDAMLMLVQTPDIASKVNKAEDEISRLKKEEKKVKIII